LIWGDQTPRTYFIYKVSEFGSQCSVSEIEILRKQVNKLGELYALISWHMPLMFFALTTIFELYLSFFA